MKLNGLWRVKLAQVFVGTAIVIALLLAARSSAQAPGNNPLHLPTDWSHRHMVFSPPTSFWQAWELQKEPRYWHQRTRRNAWAMRSANVRVEGNDHDRGGNRDHDGDRDRDDDDAPVPVSNSARRDWGAYMLAGGTVGAGMFPAKFTFNVNATPSCASDFVAFNTSLMGAADTVAATQTGTFTGIATAARTVTIGSPNGATITLTATGILGSNTGLNFQSSLLNATEAANLASAINRNGAAVGVTAASAGAVVTVTAATGGDGNLITLATTLPAGQFTWGSATLAGGVGTANVVAFNQLYTSQSGGVPAGFCGTNGPSVYWSYFTGIGTAVTSIVLSLDGTKVAFVENVAGTATLRILKWKAGQGTTPGKPVAPTTTLTAGQNWTTNCPAANSCMSSIAFSGAAATDTKSPPFYNYATDELYVGNDKGVLHKFTGVFLGTPTEVGAAGKWPITVNAGAILTGPVYDDTSKNIFVGDSTGLLSFIKELTSTTGACSAGSPPCLGLVSQALTGSIVDAPYVDASTGRVMVFDGTETTKQGSVFQFDTGLTTASKVTAGIGGNGTTPPANLPFDILHGGAFDDAYFSVGPGSGHLYTCGKDPGFNNRPAIYQLSFTGPSPGPAGVLVTTAIPAALANLTTTFSLIGDACSPVSEIKNGATDRIFFSFATNANPPSGGGTATGCTAGQGCVASIDVSSFVVGGAGTWPPTATTAGIAAPFILTGAQTGSGGTSGIVVDNVGVGAQESSIYYTFQTNSTAGVTCNTTTGVGCAVKVTQSGLQ
jgi:hypothetical protein